MSESEHPDGVVRISRPGCGKQNDQDFLFSLEKISFDKIPFLNDGSFFTKLR